MTAREIRTRRRAEERKTRKSQTKPLESLTAPLSHQDLGVSRETLEEFGPNFIAEANVIRDCVHSGVAIIPGQSTGPRTSTGKAASARNSFKHGLASGAIVVPGEDPAAFDALLNDLAADHAPANCTEQLLVREMAQAYWLMQRATRLQNACFTNGEADCKQLALFLRYRTTYERAFHKALDRLTQLKKQRESANRHFVSQNSRKQARPSKFVSQKAPESVHAAEFVRQKSADSPHQMYSFALSRR